ncbi:hypothetical protein BDW72DRAFT_194795 [Aspergillus terricola var. indicus]
MAITELLLPTFKTDPESKSLLQTQAPSLFFSFRGVPGLTSFFRGRILADAGEPVGEGSGRGVLILEWDELSSFHAFYPNSRKFQEFVAVARQFVKAPEYPELFETRISSVPCTESSVTQIIIAVEKHETERTWKKLQTTVESQRTGAAAFSSAGGIEDQHGHFLGMIGWQSLQEYEQARANEDVAGLLRELGGGKMLLNIVVQVERMAV